MTQDTLKIVNLKIKELTPNPDNPRENKSTVPKLAELIKSFGFLVPLVVNKDFQIIAGHARYLAAKKLKLVEVPCVIAEHLSSAQEKAFLIADNQIQKYSHFDNDKLTVIFESLAREDNFDLTLTAFTPEEIETFIVDTDLSFLGAELPSNDHPLDLEPSSKPSKRRTKSKDSNNSLEDLKEVTFFLTSQQQAVYTQAFAEWRMESDKEDQTDGEIFAEICNYWLES
jgi:site-specific DNA-methyltransferase (adenine-specific)